MKSAVWITLLGLAFGWQANAATLKIVSPDRARASFARGKVVWHELNWDGLRHTLYAHVTLMSSTGGEWLASAESFVFDLPGVRLDPNTRTFTARTKDGQEIPVASLEKGFLGLGSYAKPMPGTVISIYVKGNEVTVALTGTTECPMNGGGGTWVVLDGPVISD